MWERRFPRSCLNDQCYRLSIVLLYSGGSKKFEGGGGEDNLQLRPHLSQMRTTKYMYIFMPFTRKKRLFEKIWANRPPFESAIVAVVGKLN